MPLFFHSHELELLHSRLSNKISFAKQIVSISTHVIVIRRSEEELHISSDLGQKCQYTVGSSADLGLVAVRCVGPAIQLAHCIAVQFCGACSQMYIGSKSALLVEHTYIWNPDSLLRHSAHLPDTPPAGNVVEIYA